MLTRKTYLIILATIMALLMFLIFRVENWQLWCLIVMIASLWGTSKDAKQISWLRFMPAGLLTLLIFYIIYKYANPFWFKVVAWQTESMHHTFNWNEWFNSIPGNAPWMFQLWQPEWLTTYMQSVYIYGFTLTYWLCIIRAFFTKDVKKFGRYALAGYLLQVPLILPFYNLIFLQEVWYVQGTPDLLERGLTAAEAFNVTINCFPSMHTSIAFAAVLLAMRERSKWYRWIVGVFGISIMISTLYLNIHWIIDMFAGMLFAYGCVKLADWIVDRKAFDRFTNYFEGFGAKLEQKLIKDNPTTHDKDFGA
ncbi:phosphatase PAP2 family protein [Paenibacillus agilis]|uniref:Phosphatase PAP2 family protein n=1 Tax=Paenibacillus agilis TaxID=3020863 RepID=A0A559IYH1_9BACL|nr:phosphatase PAP2 family protein [Paenibacillus agilis]TVX92680.1 phosphatase PAP2 family protein [Paenibacillus agilis]